MAEPLNNSDPASIEAATFAIADILKREEEAPAAPEPVKEEPEPPSRFALPGKEAEEPQETAAAVEETEEEPQTPTETQPTQRTAADETAQREAAEKQARETAERNTAIQNINAVVAQLQAQVQGEFSDLKSYDDLMKLAETDPQRYNRFVVRQHQLAQAQQVQTQAFQVVQQEQAKQFQAWQAKEQERLPQLIPELNDPEKAPETARAIQEFAARQGYSPERLAQASATDFQVLYLAMKAVQHEASAKAQTESQKKAQDTARAKAASAPPVQRPGAQRATGKDDQVMTDYNRLRKSGHIDDAARLFKTLNI